MIKKYELSYLCPIEYYDCMYKIQDCIKHINSTKEFYETLLNMFLNRTYEFRKYITLFNGVHKIHSVRFCRVFSPFEISEKEKDFLVSKLMDYYNKEKSLYGLQTYNTGDTNSVFFSPVDILKGRNKSWVFDNGLNEIMLVEHRYNEVTGERMYNCSEFLEKVCDNYNRR